MGLPIRPMISKIARATFVSSAIIVAAVSAAEAGTPYDGRWSLNIQTTRGDCSTYNFPVDINNGRVSFPGLVRANGRVTANGSVRVFVAAMGKTSSGAGRLTRSSGSGRWSGKSGRERCSGVWTAHRT
jgi:hypothetical protein